MRKSGGGELLFSPVYLVLEIVGYSLNFCTMDLCLWISYHCVRTRPGLALFEICFVCREVTASKIMFATIFPGVSGFDYADCLAC